MRASPRAPSKVLPLSLAVCSALVVALAPAYSQEKASKQEQIARGAYLTALGGCNDCHTPGGLYGAPDMARTLAGSDLGWQGPWGTTYPPNLTPDVQTGIGRWSEADIVKALRQGVRPDGTPLRPPMPWPNLRGLTDADAFAIAAYLKSLPPVRHAVPNALPPGAQAQGPIVRIPPPPAWDAPRPPAGAGAPGAHGAPSSKAR